MSAEEKEVEATVIKSGPSVLRREVPDEVIQPIASHEYKELRLMTDMREPFRIPGEYLLGTKKLAGADLATTPLIAFVNGRSGGHMGSRLLTVLSRSLGQSQVFDLSEDKPVNVLRTLWANLKAREVQGDNVAQHIRKNLRILAAGGDGTVTWILKSIFDLGLDPAPSVAVLPLGTGNDLALSFGWGNAFKDKWIRADQLYRTLGRYVEASPRALDAWRITLVGPGPELFDHLPHSLGPLSDGESVGALAPPGPATGPQAEAVAAATPGPKAPGQPHAAVGGMFWNYFSVGLDAQAAYGFHALREAHSWAASTRLANQAWYSYFSCSSGWFCGASPLKNRVRLRGRGGPEGGDDKWRDIRVPNSVRAIVVLNLQSYGGGRDIWGLAGSGESRSAAATTPIFSDGLVEVVGFRDGWHTALVMGQLSSKIHAARLAQLAELEITLQPLGGKVKDEESQTYMQLDGEPWPQLVPPPSAEPLRVIISRAGQSSMLMNDTDTQGPAKVKKLAKRGAEKGATLDVPANSSH